MKDFNSKAIISKALVLVSVIIVSVFVVKMREKFRQTRVSFFILYCLCLVATNFLTWLGVP